MQYNGSYTEYVRNSLNERLSALESIVQQQGAEIKGITLEVEYAKNLARLVRKEARIKSNDLNQYDQRINALEQLIRL